MVTINSGFIGEFKTCDNINHTLRILRKLYEYFENEGGDGKGLLSKPIIILLASMTEAILYDFHLRAHNNIREGVPNVSDEDSRRLQENQVDKFAACVQSARRLNLLDDADGALYDELDRLRGIRNRMHIQNQYNERPADENLVFTQNNKELAERVFEKTASKMAERFPRPPGIQRHIGDFNCPWHSHLD